MGNDNEMNEVDDAREALSRVEKHVERFRWICTHPFEAEAVFFTLRTVLHRAPTMSEVVRKIDSARNGS
jgi:hypothetical protein